MNILFLLTDQHSYETLGYSGNELIRTPNLDRLASEGVYFKNAVCTTPYCSPTRASLLTGQYPHSHGLTGNASKVQRLTSDSNTTEGICARNGFNTYHSGKWHVGDKHDFDCYQKSPLREDLAKAHRESLANVSLLPARGDERLHGDVYVTPEMDRFIREWEDYNGIVGRIGRPAEAHFEQGLVDSAIDWMEENKEDPFMMTVSLNPPHAPWTAPDPYYSMYDPDELKLPLNFEVTPEEYAGCYADKMGKMMGEANIREKTRCYYAQISLVDDLLGKLLKAVDRLGLREDTLVIYTSDHGDLHGSHGMEGKVVETFYEEILRVPLIFRHPQLIQAGKVVSYQANSVDLCPTLLDYCGLQIPETVQGQSLRPWIEGERPADESGYAFAERPMVEFRGYARMVRTAEWKYNLHLAPNGQREELFDLTNDPYEKVNCVAENEHQPIREKLRERLIQHFRDTEDPALDLLPAEGVAL